MVPVCGVYVVCVVNTCGRGGVEVVVSVTPGGTSGRMSEGQSIRALPKGGLLRSGGEESCCGACHSRIALSTSGNLQTRFPVCVCCFVLVPTPCSDPGREVSLRSRPKRSHTRFFFFSPSLSLGTVFGLPPAALSCRASWALCAVQCMLRQALPAPASSWQQGRGGAGVG